MSEREAREAMDLRDLEPVMPDAAELHPRAVGAPLSMGPSRSSSASAAVDGKHSSPPPPPGRSLPGATAPREPATGVQRAVNVLRSALPFVQRFLPLLDGNAATTVTRILGHKPPPQQPPVDLVPIEEGLADLQLRHSQLREQVMEQNTSLKRVEDQLEMVREATDRNTLEQQELLEDLRSFGAKVKIGALVLLGFVVVAFVLNLILYLHIQRFLP
jgi:hypothetical protein